jgi:PST family polysaccharide transporter
MSRVALREGLLWTGFSKYFGRILTAVSTFILAKFLVPEDFGIVAICMVVIQGLQIFRDIGIPASIVTDKESSQELVDTGATIFIGLGILIFILSLILAPLFSSFLNDPRLTTPIRVMSLSILFTSFSLINSTIAQKELKFKKNAQPAIFSQAFYVFSSIVLAYLGWGYWSIIISSVLSSLLGTILYYIIFPVSFKIRIDRECLKRIRSFSIYAFINGVLIFLFINLDRIAIGKFVDIEQVGYYYLAFKVANLPAEYIYSIVISLLLPYFSKLTLQKLKERYIETVKFLGIIIIPISFLLALIVKPLFYWLYQDKWMPVIPLIYILTIYAITRSLFGPMGTYVYAKRKPNILTAFLILQIILVFGGLFVFRKYLTARNVAIIFTVISVFLFLVWILYTKYKEDIPMSTFFKNIFPPIIVSVTVYLFVSLMLKPLELRPINLILSSVGIYTFLVVILYFVMYRNYIIKFFEFIRNKKT